MTNGLFLTPITFIFIVRTGDSIAICARKNLYNDSKYIHGNCINFYSIMLLLFIVNIELTDVLG